MHVKEPVPWTTLCYRLGAGKAPGQEVPIEHLFVTYVVSGALASCCHCAEVPIPELDEAEAQASGCTLQCL